MMTEIKVKEQFYEYLADKFGESFTELIEPPEGVMIGERMLYKLQNGQKAERKEMTQKDIDKFHQMVADIAEKNGGVALESEPPVTSGLPYPRVVDILDWSDVAMDIPAKKYVLSDDLLPKDNFAIEWLFGVVFSPSGKQLVYIDFTHPKVKVAFSADYDAEYDFTIGLEMPRRLRQFKEKRAEIIQEVESRSNVLWAKLVQLDDETFMRLKNKRPGDELLELMSKKV